MRYQKGDYFGELALLNNEPRAATVLASSNCKVVSIDGESFKVGFGQLMIYSDRVH
jgi:cAMP-dependent protein kinase regulator